MKKYWCIEPECEGIMRRLYMRVWEDGLTHWKGTDQWMCEVCGRILKEEALKKYWK